MTDETKDPLAHPDEPGAYVGRKPERQAETIPGGVRPDAERIAAHSPPAGEARGERTPGGPPRSAPRLSTISSRPRNSSPTRTISRMNVTTRMIALMIARNIAIRRI